MTKVKNTDAPDHHAAAQIAREWLDEFAAAIASSKPGAVAALLTDDAYWRDIVALSWDIRTFSGNEKASIGIVSFARDRRPCDFMLDAASVQSLERAKIGPSIEAFFNFETDIGLCRDGVPGRGVAWGRGGRGKSRPGLGNGWTGRAARHVETDRSGRFLDCGRKPPAKSLFLKISRAANQRAAARSCLIAVPFAGDEERKRRCGSSPRRSDEVQRAVSDGPYGSGSPQLGITPQRSPRPWSTLLKRRGSSSENRRS